jgi:hypothetical protein
LDDVGCAIADGTIAKKKLLAACKDLMRENAFLRLKLATMATGNSSTDGRSVATHGQNSPDWSVAGSGVDGKLGGFRPLVARVIRRDIAHWTDEVTIDAGSWHGVAVGMGVIARDRVVGRIREIHGRTAVVELITSPQFRIVVHAAGDGGGFPIVFSGDGWSAMDRAIGRATNVPVALFNGENAPTLVTSGLTGIFPENITVGTVCQPTTADGNYCSAPVTLDNDLLSRLREVVVLVDGPSEVTGYDGAVENGDGRGFPNGSAPSPVEFGDKIDGDR